MHRLLAARGRVRRGRPVRRLLGGISPPGCDGYYDGSFCPAPNGKWPLISDSPPCHFYFTCVDGVIDQWFVGCGDGTPFFDPVTLECVPYTGQECLCP